MCQSIDDFGNYWLTLPDALALLAKRGVKYSAASLGVAALATERGQADSVRSKKVGSSRIYWKADLENFTPPRGGYSIRFKKLNRKKKKSGEGST